MRARVRLQRILRPHGKDSWVSRLPVNARLFDIGCGNESPQRVKAQRPDVHYIGLDVGDYAQSTHSIGMADDYRIVPSSEFAAAISEEKGTMDAVISSHNLEHCDDPDSVLRAMCRALKPAGRLYLSFPCEESVRFPSRKGTLCFSDDQTHREPPSWERVLAVMSQSDVRVVWLARRYRAAAAFLLGAALEPASAISGRVMPLGSTWAFWGFESVIWAERSAAARTA
jgi:SAM-dependent methyltransferase